MAGQFIVTQSTIPEPTMRQSIVTPPHSGANDSGLSDSGASRGPAAGQRGPVRRSPGMVGANWLIQLRLSQLESDPALQPWLLRAIIHRTQKTMIGHIGFHDYPGAAYLHAYADRRRRNGLHDLSRPSPAGLCP
ncbi:MAG: hypothetical protein R2932_59490 [Caldilineaceae bacterium]